MYNYCHFVQGWIEGDPELSDLAIADTNDGVPRHLHAFPSGWVASKFTRLGSSESPSAANEIVLAKEIVDLEMNVGESHPDRTNILLDGLESGHCAHRVVELHIVVQDLLRRIQLTRIQ